MKRQERGDGGRNGREERGEQGLAVGDGRMSLRETRKADVMRITGKAVISHLEKNGGHMDPENLLKKKQTQN